MEPSVAVGGILSRRSHVDRGRCETGPHTVDCPSGMRGEENRRRTGYMRGRGGSSGPVSIRVAVAAVRSGQLGFHPPVCRRSLRGEVFSRPGGVERTVDRADREDVLGCRRREDRPAVCSFVLKRVLQRENVVLPVAGRGVFGHRNVIVAVCRSGVRDILTRFLRRCRLAGRRGGNYNVRRVHQVEIVVVVRGGPALPCEIDTDQISGRGGDLYPLVSGRKFIPAVGVRVGEDASIVSPCVIAGGVDPEDSRPIGRVGDRADDPGSVPRNPEPSHGVVDHIDASGDTCVPGVFQVGGGRDFHQIEIGSGRHIVYRLGYGGPVFAIGRKAGAGEVEQLHGDRKVAVPHRQIVADESAVDHRNLDA